MRSCLLILFCLLVFCGRAQSRADSLTKKDSIAAIDSLLSFETNLRLDSLRADSLAAVQPPLRDTIKPTINYALTSDSFLYRRRLFFSFTNPVRYTISQKAWQGKETVFYVIIGLLVLFAFLKNAFSRYLSDLYSTYFRTTVRQRQLKEQLLQSPLPSLLFNVFFIFSAAVFLALLAQRFSYGVQFSFPLMSLYCAIGIALIYGGKFVLLKIFGWILQLSDATDNYLFAVFSTNKILGVFLLPFIVLLAFTSGLFNTTVVTLSLVVILGLYAYRFFLAFLVTSSSVRINFFHFLLYLAAFEIIPLLLINKALFIILREMA